MWAYRQIGAVRQVQAVHRWQQDLQAAFPLMVVQVAVVQTVVRSETSARLPVLAGWADHLRPLSVAVARQVHPAQVVQPGQVVQLETFSGAAQAVAQVAVIPIHLRRLVRVVQVEPVAVRVARAAPEQASVHRVGMEAQDAFIWKFSNFSRVFMSRHFTCRLH